MPRRQPGQRKRRRKRWSNRRKNSWLPPKRRRVLLPARRLPPRPLRRELRLTRRGSKPLSRDKRQQLRLQPHSPRAPTLLQRRHLRHLALQADAALALGAVPIQQTRQLAAAEAQEETRAIRH